MLGFSEENNPAEYSPLKMTTLLHIPYRTKFRWTKFLTEKKFSGKKIFPPQLEISTVFSAENYSFVLSFNVSLVFL